MAKIEKLTKEQEARFPEFVEKWTKIGLSTDPLDRTAVLASLDKLYGQVKKKRPGTVLFCHSPLELALIVACLRNANVSANVLDNVRANVRANVLANVRDNVLANVRDNVLANVLANVRANVRANVLDNVSANVRANVRANVLDNVSANVSANVLANVRDNVLANVLDNVSANVRANVLDNVLDNVSANVRANVLANVRANVLDNVSANVLDNVSDLLRWWYDFGQYDAYWLSYYDFVGYMLGQDVSALGGNRAVCESSGWSILFWEFGFVSEKPLHIHRNGRGQLHRDGEAALLHSDGWGVYALNGIRMKPCQVLTPAEKITPEEVLSEANADVRRELIRKVGVERMLSKLPHSVLDKSGTYEVLSVQLSPEVLDARYLRMLNPSIGVWHLEGVAPECDTVEKSLNWRNQQFFQNAEILT